MEKVIKVTSLLVLCFSVQVLYAKNGPVKVVKKQPVKVDNIKASYALGQQIGNSLKKLQGQLKTIGMSEIDLDSFINGLKSCLSGKQPLVTEAEAAKIRSQFFAEIRTKREAQRKIIGQENLKKGQAFLAENKKKEGIITTKSGLQYKVIKEGTGKKPTKLNRVSVNYRGTLIDGTEFDSSYKRGKPATFQVGRVIKGWQEALCLMSVGSKYKLFIPPEIGYGARGSGTTITPNSVLIFDVELLDILSAPPPRPKTSRISSPRFRRSNTSGKNVYGPPLPKKK